MPESYQIDFNQYAGCAKVCSTPASRGLAAGSFVFIPVTHAVFICAKEARLRSHEFDKSFNTFFFSDKTSDMNWERVLYITFQPQ